MHLNTYFKAFLLVQARGEKHTEHNVAPVIVCAGLCEDRASACMWAVRAGLRVNEATQSVAWGLRDHRARRQQL